MTGKIATVRIWTYTAHQRNWVDNAAQWRERTKQIEDKLSDALHEKLTARFVDKRTSVLIKGMKTQMDLQTEISSEGIVSVEGQKIGTLNGLRFIAETGNGKFADKVLLNAADKALNAEIQKRANAVLQGTETDFDLTTDGNVCWNGAPIGRLVAGADVLHPAVAVSVQENFDAVLSEKVKAHLNRWLAFHLSKTAAPLYNALNVLNESEASGTVRAVLYQMTEKLGIIRREKLKDILKNLTEDDKKLLAKAGVRLGYDYLFFPMLLKPAAQKTCALLWKLSVGGLNNAGGFALDGKMSLEVDAAVPKSLYLVQGYVLTGKRAIRVDVMERFTSKLRELTRKGKDKPHLLPPDLLSTAGLKRDEAADVFAFLGFNVYKETQKQDDKETEILMICQKTKKSKPQTKKETAKAVDKDSPFACLSVLKKK